MILLLLLVSKQKVRNISGSHGGECEDDCLRECCVVSCGRSLPTFHWCLLPHRPGYAGTKHLWNIGHLLTDNKMKHPRRQYLHKLGSFCCKYRAHDVFTPCMIHSESLLVENNKTKLKLNLHINVFYVYRQKTVLPHNSCSVSQSALHRDLQHTTLPLFKALLQRRGTAQTATSKGSDVRPTEMLSQA